MKFQAIHIFLPILLLYLLESCTLTTNQKKQLILPFWSQQKKGTNFFNRKETASRFLAAHSLGVDFIRLTPSKWKSRVAQNKFFMMRLDDNHHYQGIAEPDAIYLRQMLDLANDNGLKVELTLLDLPHHIWSQHNNGVQERGIFKNKEFQLEAIAFIRDVANIIKDHPAIVGFNPLNEPSPEKLSLKNGPNEFPDWYTPNQNGNRNRNSNINTTDYEKWFLKIEGTVADLNLFNQAVYEAVRSVAPTLPLIFDSGYYATPWAFTILKPIHPTLEKGQDLGILYAFHFYEPFAFTNRKNQNRYHYPGTIPIGEKEKHSLVWNREQLKNFLSPIREWQKRYNISNHQIVVEEFGVYRKNEGAVTYFADLISIFNDFKWHWAFYSFREDEWDGMDYELGTGQPFSGYWKSIDNGESPNYDNAPQNNKNPFLKALSL